MSKTNSWKCDICGKIFDKNSAGYSATAEVKITIPSGSQYEGETSYFFEDTCLDCRINLKIAIDDLIKTERKV